MKISTHYTPKHLLLFTFKSALVRLHGYSCHLFGITLWNSWFLCKPPAWRCSLGRGKRCWGQGWLQGTAPSQLDLQSWLSGDHQDGRRLQLVKVTPEHFFQDSVGYSLRVCWNSRQGHDRSAAIHLLCLVRQQGDVASVCLGPWKSFCPAQLLMC